MKRTIPFVAACVLLFAASCPAQAPQAPKPGPEVQRLAYNLGTWKWEGEMKPFGGMPGGKFTSTETCKWFSGGFFVVCDEEGSSPMGSDKGMSFTGYDPNSKKYTYHEYSSMGEMVDAKGTVEGDTWHWTAESEQDGKKISVRVTIKEVSKTQFTFKLEMSQDGGEFTTFEEATAKKVS